MRYIYLVPPYSESRQTAKFLPRRWQMDAARRLYRAARKGGMGKDDARHYIFMAVGS